MIKAERTLLYKTRIQQEVALMVMRDYTYRDIAAELLISKSTVCDDMKRCKLLYPNTYKQVEEIIKRHYEEKHLRGGVATKQVFLRKKLKID